jgi:hypothetical protein
MVGDVLHKILYFIRKNPLINKLLYSKYGYSSAEKT